MIMYITVITCNNYRETITLWGFAMTQNLALFLPASEVSLAPASPKQLDHGYKCPLVG